MTGRSPNRGGGRRQWWLVWSAVVTAGVLAGCVYQPYAGPLEPAATQDEGMSVLDDRSVVYQRERFEVRVRPMTDAELNRQFAANSKRGPKSTNAYTYGDTRFAGLDSTETRFTVFQVAIKNYSYPKVVVDPARALLQADNGRRYWSLSLAQLANYYRAYALGFRGNEFARYRERVDLARRTRLTKQPVFSGQEASGYLVFPVLHPDVRRVRLLLKEVALRFDYRDEPVETIDLSFAFGRATGRLLPDGRRVVTLAPEREGR